MEEERRRSRLEAAASWYGPFQRKGQAITTDNGRGDDGLLESPSWVNKMLGSYGYAVEDMNDGELTTFYESLVAAGLQYGGGGQWRA